MKTRIKQLISVLVVCLLMMGLLPVSSFAASMDVTHTALPNAGDTLKAGETITNSSRDSLRVFYYENSDGWEIGEDSIAQVTLANGESLTAKSLAELAPTAPAANRSAFKCWAVCYVYESSGYPIEICLVPVFDYLQLSGPADVAVTSGDPAEFTLGLQAAEGGTSLVSWFQLLDDNLAISDSTDAQMLEDTGLAAGWAKQDGVWTSQNSDKNNGDTHKFDATSVTMTSSKFTAADGDMLSLDYRLSSEDNYDILTIEVFLNGESNPYDVFRVDKSFQHYQLKTFDLQQGTYTIRITYSKDSGGSAGDDCAYVKNVLLSKNISYGDSTTLTVSEETNADFYANGNRFFAYVSYGKIVDDMLLPKEAEISRIATLTLAQPYSVTYNTNGAEAIAEGKYSAATLPFTLAVPADRDGFTFGGWYDNAELSGSPVTTLPAGATGNQTFWAKWTAKETSSADTSSDASSTGSSSESNSTGSSNISSSQTNSTANDTPPATGSSTSTVLVMILLLVAACVTMVFVSRKKLAK